MTINIGGSHGTSTSNPSASANAAALRMEPLGPWRRPAMIPDAGFDRPASRTCPPGGLGCKVGRKLLEDVGHLLLNEQADETGGGAEFERQRAWKASSPPLDGGLQGLAQVLHVVVWTLLRQERLRLES